MTVHVVTRIDLTPASIDRKTAGVFSNYIKAVKFVESLGARHYTRNVWQHTDEVTYSIQEWEVG